MSDKTQLMNVIGTIDHKRKKVKLSCPATAQVYNKFMGGVDKADMLFLYIKQNAKQTKWYYQIFFQLLTLSVVNAWTIYREIGGNGALLDFIISSYRRLISATSETAMANIKNNPKTKIRNHSQSGSR